MPALSSFVVKAGIFKDLLSFLWQRKIWWLIPLIILFILFIGVLLIESSAGLAPFVYTFL